MNIFALMEFPNIWHRQSSAREKLTSDNVTFEDFTQRAQLWVGCLKRFEGEAESRFGMVANQQADKLIEIIRMMKVRTNDIRYELNNGKPRRPTQKGPKAGDGDEVG